jgi:hypothetical protein
MYVYIQSEPGLWTVGFYLPNGQFQPENDYPNPERAAARVHFLNGGDAVSRTSGEALNARDGSSRP